MSAPVSGPWDEAPKDFGEVLYAMFRQARERGVPAGVPFRRMSPKQLDAVADALAAAATAVLRVQRAQADAGPRGKAGLRLVAEDGQFVVTPRTLAAQRRRKPIHVGAR